MQKLILMLSVFLLTISCATQRRLKEEEARLGVPHYKSLRALKKDSAQYLKSNFMDRKQFYIGKEVRVLLKDLETTVKSVSLSDMFYKYEGKGRYADVALHFYDWETFYEYGDKKDFIPVLIVNFAAPYLVRDPIDSLSVKYKRDGILQKWNPESQEIIGRQIIRDIKYYNEADFRIKPPVNVKQH
jgi:hypothetical protein